MDTKIDKILKDNHLPVTQDLLTEVHRLISSEISENYDNYVFSLLEQFGITKDNWRKHVGRITIVMDQLWVEHFFIDKEYRFSIVEEPGELIFDDDGECKCVITHRVEVFECMRGERV